jgi:hypothetical protein
MNSNTVFSSASTDQLRRPPEPRPHTRQDRFAQYADAVVIAPHSIFLRLARTSDASYIPSPRTSLYFNQHLLPAPASTRAQTDWLERYIKRESAMLELYFVVRNKATGLNCGAVRLYDLRPESFCWGSWILDANKPRVAPLVTALFIYDFRFGSLGYDESHFDVRRGNNRVIAFQERFGARRVRSEGPGDFFTLERGDLQSRLCQLKRLTSYSPVFLEEERV